VKLFVSYARVDKPLCKQIVDRLSGVHDVWYDQRLYAGQDWWEEIQNRLRWCEGFIYLLSPESVNSEYCQREYNIAAQAAKHIFPVLIQTRTEIPESLKHIQYADLSGGMEDLYVLLNAITIAERRGPRPQILGAEFIKNETQVFAPEVRTVNPIGEAADAMEAGDFDKAVFILKQEQAKNPQGRTARILDSMLKEAEQALERQAFLREVQREYAPIVELVKRESTRQLGCEEFADFRKDYPNYDPENLSKLCNPAGLFWNINIDEDKAEEEFSPNQTDELYSQAVDMVRRLDKASISLLQRRLRIGYTRAAKLIEKMEQDGIVGPVKETGQLREVIKPSKD
jgi:hypothetical protein